MKLGNKKELITATILFLIIFGFVLFIFIGLNQRKRELVRNPAYGSAIIVDIYVGAKARDFVRYEFLVNGKIYDGHKNYMPHRQLVKIGDTCEVVYAISNPEINKLLTDDNNLLKLKRKE